MELLAEPAHQTLDATTLHHEETADLSFAPDFVEMGVLALHEDLVTGLRAKTLLNTLQEQLELKINLQADWFRFEMLEDAALAGPIMAQASQSRMVVLSLHGDRPLSTAVQDWILNWANLRDFTPCALVLLLDAGTVGNLESNSTCNFLRAITGPLGIDLFCLPPAQPGH